MIPSLNILAPCALLLCFGTANINAFVQRTSISSRPQLQSSHIPLEAWGRGKSNAAADRSNKPTFDEQANRWEPPANEDTSECYGPVGSLLRHGPGPFITRVTNPDKYEQAVLKYQASEGCSRLEAMGNMDAYFNNAADWAYQKQAEKNGAPKVDFARLDVEQAVKTTVWAVFVTPFLARIVYLIVTTGSYGVKLEDIFNI